MTEKHNNLSESLKATLATMGTTSLERVFASLYLKNTEVLRCKEFLQKQSAAEVLRQISVMTALAASHYPFSELALTTFDEVPELAHAFSTPAGRLRIRDLFTEWVTTNCPEKKWPAKGLSSRNHVAHTITIWDSAIQFEHPELYKPLLLMCLLSSYFEFSLTTLREFSVSKTAYKRSKSLRELHLSIASTLRDVCGEWPLAEVSCIMRSPLDRAILTQAAPETPLLTPAV